MHIPKPPPQHQLWAAKSCGVATCRQEYRCNVEDDSSRIWHAIVEGGNNRNSWALMRMCVHAQLHVLVNWQLLWASDRLELTLLFPSQLFIYFYRGSMCMTIYIRYLILYRFFDMWLPAADTWVTYLHLHATVYELLPTMNQFLHNTVIPFFSACYCYFWYMIAMYYISFTAFIIIWYYVVSVNSYMYGCIVCSQQFYFSFRLWFHVLPTGGWHSSVQVVSALYRMLQMCLCICCIFYCRCEHLGRSSQ